VRVGGSSPAFPTTINKSMISNTSGSNAIVSYDFRVEKPGGHVYLQSVTDPNLPDQRRNSIKRVLKSAPFDTILESSFGRSCKSKLRICVGLLEI
jgi:hypothetical protein